MKELVLFENDKIYARITSSVVKGSYSNQYVTRVEYTVSWKPKNLKSRWIPTLTTSYQKTAYKRFSDLTKASVELSFVDTTECITKIKEMTLF